MNNEVGRWMDMLPPNVLEQLEQRATKESWRPHRDIDGLNAEHFHQRCSEKLLQAVDILTEVIIMHNSLSAHSGSSVPIAHPATDDCASEKQSDDTKKKENMEYSSPMCHQIGESILDKNTVDESLALTPESLEYVAGSNFNIWLELNDFDLEGASIGPYDTEEAGSWMSCK
ncbi:hypothetical protein N7517_004268 [Penicillium concentricum]|uniref:Uncharacterized protein n=1 Tax=Penicillium concentricum TaxID=293559 RepID=A0A9W9S575_9EURO|nr:uncharacterized protein N7517_004268 [Penicillium concentricum]KAJ5372262.1 hypothetical protein N7517_004268 [Penicillium concentricum]